MKRGRGVVVQVAANDHVIVMTAQGEFARVPFTKPVCVGQEIFYTIKRPPALWKWSIVAALFLAIVSSASQIQEIPGGTAPVCFVTLDINPSIELGLNSMQRVVTAEGLNRAGVELLKRKRIIGQDLKQALASIEQQAEQDGYLTPGENKIVMTFSEDGVDDFRQLTFDEIEMTEREEISNNLEILISDVVKQTLATVYHVQVWQVPTNVRQEARKAGVTPANYIAVHVGLQTVENVDEKKTTPIAATIERDGYVYELGLDITRPIFEPTKTMSISHKE